jgi:hypothetical protein
MHRAGTGKKHNETPEKANGSTDLASIGRFPFGCTEVVAEQFVGAVDKMDLHVMTESFVHIEITPSQRINVGIPRKKTSCSFSFQ